MSDPNQVRINELARELEVKAKAIIDLLPGFGVTEKKTHSSSIPLDVANKVRRAIQGQAEAEAAAEAAAKADKEAREAAAKAARLRPATPPAAAPVTPPAKPAQPAAPAPPAAAKPAAPHVPAAPKPAAPATAPSAPPATPAAKPPVAPVPGQPFVLTLRPCPRLQRRPLCGRQRRLTRRLALNLRLLLRAQPLPGLPQRRRVLLLRLGQCLLEIAAPCRPAIAALSPERRVPRAPAARARDNRCARSKPAQPRADNSLPVLVEQALHKIAVSGSGPAPFQPARAQDRACPAVPACFPPFRTKCRPKPSPESPCTRANPRSASARSLTSANWKANASFIRPGSAREQETAAPLPLSPPRSLVPRATSPSRKASPSASFLKNSTCAPRICLKSFSTRGSLPASIRRSMSRPLRNSPKPSTASSPSSHSKTK